MAVKYVKDFVFEQPRGFTGSVSHKKPPGMKKDLAPAKPFKGAYEGYEDGGMVAARGMPARAKPNAPARGAARMESPPSVGKRQGYAQGGAAKPRMSAAQQRALAQALARQAADRRAAAVRPAAKAAPGAMGDREGMGETRGGAGVTVEPPRLPGPTIDVSRPAPRPVVRQTAPATRKAPSTFRGLEPGTGPKGVGPVVGGFSSMDLVYDPRTNTVGPSVIGSSNIGSQNAPYVFNPRHLKKGGLAYAKGAKAEKKVEKVMGEYKRGKLHSGSKKGPLVKNPKQAIAIALSEARRMKKADGGYVKKKVPKGVDEIDVAILATKNFQDAAEKKYKNDMSLGSLLGFAKPKEYDKRFEETKKRMKDRGDEAFYSKHRQMPEDAKRSKRALEKMRHAEKYAPGKSLDMPDKKAHGGMMRRKMA